ncbi:uroporphyrinogen-III synthase [Parvibaculum sp.]|uniref:uroporphyrinogen-III synthase n=1 Tax=Parvibaculum sp. TaxID=2024848 RepID=UPI001B2750FA|nr:uroporphyrinogen-III synthase [Parvibaculum sp.]MBO6669631.1 uroporphyrinogen-III synthase [Parvibaculum sp.]MBO6692818.1 uroporphyrinogen-III synthase [Parvibaculum sp.]MBO6716071.1 uroporphyrinogen-III synthase [Parvibaculum sp.]
MRFLVTRPEEDSAPLADALSALGHEAVLAPLLDIRFLEDAELPEAAWQALLVTSANGVRALARHDHAASLLSLPILAVGPASADAARAAGFAQVEAAGGDVNSLAEHVAKSLDPKAGPLLHVAGSAVAGDLAGMLEERGFSVTRAVLYDARLASELPEIARAALEAGSLDGVLLYSPRTARAFASLVRKAGLEARVKGLAAYCLSAAVADALDDLPGLTVKIARAPDQAALIALLPA